MQGDEGQASRIRHALPHTNSPTYILRVVAEVPVILTEVSTATPPMTTTVVYTDSPVIVTVTTSLLCTCDGAAEGSIDSDGRSFYRRGE